MSTLVVGSTAAREWFPDWREPKDLDVFTNTELRGSPPSTRYEPFWDDRLVSLFGGDTRYATPDELYTIKVSHAYWELKNGSWGKHMADLLALKSRGAALIPRWHDTLYSVWEDRHGRKPVNFDQESRTFFADAVKRRYDHDSLHRSVCYYDEPLYESVLADNSEVRMDMRRVWALPFEDQVRLFREEIYVTALERLLIPRGFRYSSGAAYQWALRRTITSLTRGKSAKFIVENFDIFKRADVDYVKAHLARKDRLIEL